MQTVFYDAPLPDRVVSGTDPIVLQVTIPANSLSDGSVLDIFGAAYQAGTTDLTLKLFAWWTPKGNRNNILEPTTMYTSDNFHVDILVFKGPDGTYHWKLQGSGWKIYWTPDGTSQWFPREAIQEGDIDPTQPIPFAVQAVGNVQPASQMTGHSLVVKVL